MKESRRWQLFISAAVVAFILPLPFLPAFSNVVDPLRGVMFNPEAYNGSANIGMAWEIWFSNPNSDILRASISREMDGLVENTHVNFLYIQVTPVLSGWPKSNINPEFISSLSGFVNLAWTKGLRVGIALNTNCVISDTYARAAGIPSRTGFSSCSDSNVQEAQAWYTDIITVVESQLKDREAVAFWEMGGSYRFANAETDIWNGAPELNDRTINGKSYPGTLSFVRQVWPIFAKATKRPTAFTFHHLPPNVIAPGSSTDNSALYNFQSMRLHPDPGYYIFTSAPTLPLPEILSRVGAGKVILGDMKWQDIPANRLYNPDRTRSAQVVRQQLSWVDSNGLAGWWVWAYRDENGIPGLRGEDGSWTSVVEVLTANTERRRQAKAGAVP